MPVAGDKIRASDILARKGCRLRRAAVQSVVTATITSLSWDTEDEDLGGYIAVTSPTVTIPTGLGGLYAITFRAAGTAISGRCFLQIVATSGITGMPAQFREYVDPTEDQATLTVSVPLLATDTFICQVFHSTGANADFTGWLSCYRLGA